MPAEGHEGLRRWICVHTPRRLCDLPGDPRAHCANWPQHNRASISRGSGGLRLKTGVVAGLGPSEAQGRSALGPSPGFVDGRLLPVSPRHLPSVSSVPVL